MSKTYLGDGVYAERDHEDYVVLTTENVISITNTIYLEPEVVLMRYLIQEHPDAVRRQG